MGHVRVRFIAVPRQAVPILLIIHRVAHIIPVREMCQILDGTILNRFATDGNANMAILLTMIKLINRPVSSGVTEAELL